ncbi:hypothetical protein CR513_08560, partial [Mucuna pruriens]
MPTSIYKSLNFVDLEPTRMTIQLANRSVVQPLGVLEDVLVQVNELIFTTDFYVLDMEDETSRKGSTLILDEANYDESWEVHNHSNFEDDITDLADLSYEVELLDILDQVCKYEDPKSLKDVEIQVFETKK